MSTGVSRGRSERSFVPQGNWQGSPHNPSQFCWGLEQRESARAVICGVLYTEWAAKMNGERAWIIGAVPVALQLSIFNTDSGEDHSIQVIHDTLLFNKYFVSYTISAYDHLIKWIVSDASHSQNNDEISMQEPFKDFDHCADVLCGYMTGVQHLVHHHMPLSQGHSWRHRLRRTIAAQSEYDVPLMKSNGLKQYFPKGWNWNLNTVIWFHRHAIWRCQISFAAASTVWRSKAQPQEEWTQIAMQFSLVARNQGYVMVKGE